MASVFVNAPGADLLTNETRRAQLLAMVAELERLPASWGARSTNLFLRDFLGYERTNEEAGVEPEAEDGHQPQDGEADDGRHSPKRRNETRQIMSARKNTDEMKQERRLDAVIDDLEHFLEWPEYAHWRGFLKFAKTQR